VGLYYLERYASSAENLRRVLMRRVERSARAHDTDRDEGAEVIDGIIQRFKEWGYLDDKAYAEMRVGSLFRRGTSRRGIRYQLSMKGVSEDAIDAALETVFENEVDPDRRSAIAYACRRRIGPWRKDNRETFRDRDLAALGRQGFAYGIARWIVEADSPEACEASLSDDERECFEH
jgi:regulatory protein